jgi:low temperature requirement protein LtrA
VVGGIIVFAVGEENTVGHVAGPLSGAARLALCGGVALYLAGLLAFGLRMIGRVRSSWHRRRRVPRRVRRRRWPSRLGGCRDGTGVLGLLAVVSARLAARAPGRA